jgi:hypothetical protein
MVDLPGLFDELGQVLKTGKNPQVRTVSMRE